MTGWKNISEEALRLIREKFIAYSPVWGASGYDAEDRWVHGDPELSRRRNEGRFIHTAAGDTQWSMITSSGHPVKRRSKYEKTLEESLNAVLQAYRELPESERKAVVGDRGAFNPRKENNHSELAPPGGLILNVYHRVLERNAQGQLQKADDLRLTDFGAPAWHEPAGFPGPQRDALWLKEEEWKSLIPRDPKKGDTFPMPGPIWRRMLVFYLSVAFAGQADSGRLMRPDCQRSGDPLTLTVEEVTPDEIRLRLQGTYEARAEGTLDRKAQIAEVIVGNQKGLPDKYELGQEGRLHGVLCYDVKKKAIRRFDLVSLGDYWGPWLMSLKVKRVPIGISFELDQSDYDLPPERRRRTNAALFMDKWFTKYNYWDPVPRKK